MRLQYLLYLILFNSILLFCTSCVQSDATISKYTLEDKQRVYWLVEPSGAIQTNDILRLQKEVPYHIVLPKYIPIELTEYPPYFIKGINSEDSSVLLIITYEAHSGPYRKIYIREDNSLISRDYSSLADDGFVLWVFKETQIFEKSSIHKGLSDIEKKEVIQRNYIWNWNSINFDCTIVDYDQNEARSIIKSIID